MYWLSSQAGPEDVWAIWNNGFSEAEIADVIKLGEARRKGEAVVSSEGVEDHIIRQSKVSWIEQSEETVWLYDKIGWIARQLNGQFFRFNLDGFAESFQYTTYDQEGSHYDWHMDKGISNGLPPRKLSFVLQLSDPSEYEGGDLEIMAGKIVEKVEKKRGLVTAFPAWVLHRVTPITKGTRRTLVVWSCGPAFK